MQKVLKKEDLETKNLDHLGIVASIIDHIGLVKKVDDRLKIRDSAAKVTMGDRVKALILNGLGFTNTTMYLVQEFFSNKPLDRLFGSDINSEDLNDDCLGRLLDEIYEYGSTKLYSELAMEIIQEQGLMGKSARMDSTNFTLFGQYDVYENETSQESNPPENQATQEVKVPPHITYGYAKSKRHDLKQVSLLLVTSGVANAPFWMESLDGNASDNKAFHETVQRVKAVQEQIKTADFPKIWIADSKFYVSDKLEDLDFTTWITRVPESIKEAKKLLEMQDTQLTWTDSKQRGYKYTELCSIQGDVYQRWVMVYSEKAYDREKKTLDKNIKKEQAAAIKDIWHMGNQVYESEKEAIKVIEKQAKKYRYHSLSWTIEPKMKYPTKGRQKEGTEKVITGYKVTAKVSRDEVAIEKELDRKGRFILATNELDEAILSSDDVLHEYKDQSQIEGNTGFKFLKDTRFEIDSFFLKKPERIEALMVVMTLCLLVNNIGQHMLREVLKEKGETIPNQVKRETATPTLRMIFSMLQGITLVRVYIDKDQGLYYDIVSNITALTEKIIRYFGDRARQIYGLEAKC